MNATATSAPIRVFLADDHQITLWGLRRLIDSSHPRMQVVGSARSLPELMGDAEAAAADVILLDLDLGGEDAAASLPGLHQRCRGHVLVFTAADDLAKHRAAVMKGARGVVHKSEPAETILNAIEKVSLGQAWLNRSLMGEVLGLLGQPAAAPTAPPPSAQARRIASLTPREREIVLAMLRNAGAKQLAIADELGLSEHTLRNHLTTIYSKLAVRGRLELHVFAAAHGLGTMGAGA